LDFGRNSHEHEESSERSEFALSRSPEIYADASIDAIDIIYMTDDRVK